MPNNISVRLAVLLVVCLVLPTCATYRPELPKDIGHRGLVVAQVDSVEDLPWLGDARAEISGSFRPEIVRSTTDNAINGYLAIPLEQGEYSFTGFSRQIGTSTILIPTVGTARYQHKEHVRMTQKFVIRPKEVTNLGLIVALPSGIVLVDNTEHMRKFLRTHYPEMASTLNINAMVLAPGNYVRAEQLPALRSDIVRQMLKARDDYAATAYCVAGPAGTLAYLERTVDGKIKEIKQFDLGTVARIASFSDDSERKRCALLTSDRRLFVVNNGRIVARNLPASLREGVLHVFGADGLVIVDDKMEIYRSVDNGQTWRQNHALVQKNQRVHRGFARTQGGYYVYSKSPSLLALGSEMDDSFKPVAIPDISVIMQLKEDASGVYLHGSSMLSGYFLYFKAKNRPDWVKIKMPNMACNEIRFNDRERTIKAFCGDMGFQSRDRGHSWERIYRPLGTLQQ